jgi:hypothetical protein
VHSHVLKFGLQPEALDYAFRKLHSYVLKFGLQPKALDYAFRKLCIAMSLSLDCSQRLWIIPSGNCVAMFLT